MSLGIIELLTRIGENHVHVQNVVENLTNVRSTKKGRETAITLVTSSQFITPNSVFHQDPPFVGLVLWLPIDRVEQAKHEHAAGIACGAGQ